VHEVWFGTVSSQSSKTRKSGPTLQAGLNAAAVQVGSTCWYEHLRDGCCRGSSLWSGWWRSRCFVYLLKSNEMSLGTKRNTLPATFCRAQSARSLASAASALVEHGRRGHQILERLATWQVCFFNETRQACEINCRFCAETNCRCCFLCDVKGVTFTAASRAKYVAICARACG
jgi:hypothetical protein